jgi:predicted N-formylglutamate amidohydrolase
LSSHVAWDPGAREVAEALAEAVGAPVFLGRWTRLYVDLNRGPSNPQCVPTVAFGVPVPGNVDIDCGPRTAVHREFWDDVAAAIRPALPEGCLHLSVHSFSPDYGGDDRDFDVGVLFDPERAGEVAMAERLVTGLENAGFHAVENRPYLGTGDGHTTWWRTLTDPARYVGIEVEISQRVPRERFGAIVGALADVLRGA